MAGGERYALPTLRPCCCRMTPAVGPAVVTEIRKDFLDCGLTIVDAGQNNLADGAKKMMGSKDVQRQR